MGEGSIKIADSTFIPYTKDLVTEEESKHFHDVFGVTISHTKRYPGIPELYWRGKMFLGVI